MAEKILVALGDGDSAGELIPYIEKIAKPGMRVVFLVRYLVDGLYWLIGQVAAMETGTRNLARAKEIQGRWSWQNQERLAEKKVSSARERLRKCGVGVDVEVYAGSLRKALRDHTVSGDVHLVVMKSSRFKSFLQGAVGAFGIFPKPAPVLLLNPARAA